MEKLFWSADHQHHWVAYTPAAGYVVFPAEEGGWTKRKPLPNPDFSRLHEVPARMAFNTGFPIQVAVAAA